MSKFLIAYVPFTGLGLHGGYRGDKWLRNRIQVFKRFVVPSLMAQTDRNFLLWVSWRPEEKENPQVKDLKRSLEGLRGLTTVFTYHGLCFWDDKYPDHEAEKRLRRSLALSLPSLRSHVEGSEWVYLTIQPSDDMYASNSFARIKAVESSEKRAIGFKHGYVMNYATKEVAEYDPDTLSPFTTIVFPVEKFTDPKAHYSHIGPYKSHEYVFDGKEPVYLEGRGYCVGVHGENISTAWSIPYKKREILGEEKERIWLKFGCWDADPVIIHKRMRLLLRNVYNLLPRSVQSLAKSLYHSVREIYVNARNR